MTVPSPTNACALAGSASGEQTWVSSGERPRTGRSPGAATSRAIGRGCVARPCRAAGALSILAEQRTSKSMRRRAVSSSTLSTSHGGTRPQRAGEQRLDANAHANPNALNSTPPHGRVDKPLPRLAHMPTGARPPPAIVNVRFHTKRRRTQHKPVVVGERKPRDLPQFLWVNTVLGNLEDHAGRGVPLAEVPQVRRTLLGRIRPPVQPTLRSARPRRAADRRRHSVRAPQDGWSGSMLRQVSNQERRRTCVNRDCVHGITVPTRCHSGARFITSAVQFDLTIVDGLPEQSKKEVCCM